MAGKPGWIMTEAERAADRPSPDSESVTSTFSHPASGILWRARIQSASQEREALALAQQLNLPDALARILVGRGITLQTAEHHLAPSLKHFLPDPSHLLDMDKAASRLAQAIEAGETIAVFGDYDVDGATSTALLDRYFKALGATPLIYIPDRMKEGYGPNLAAFESLRKQGATLIVTVDCGTVAFEPIAAISQQNIDVIVVDHHIAQPNLPNAHAIINPNRIDQDSDCGHLAAVGVSFLLLVALNRALRERGHSTLPDLLEYLDLVALGTICDVVSLTGLNRAFVTQGLKVMAKRRNAGLTALCDIARIDEPPNSYHAGFLLGPRINAGGRVGQADLGSQLLRSDDQEHCQELAVKLDQWNAERQAIEALVLENAMLQAESQANQPYIMVAQEGWHEGVIGIVAGRLKEAYDRPAMVITLKDGHGKGSARSVPGADIGAAITAAKLEGLLQAGGGHAMAGGFSLAADQLDAFGLFLQHRLEQAVQDYQLGRSYKYDAILGVGGANLSLLNQIDLAGPFGMGNPAPRFVIAPAHIVQCERMKDAHLRLLLAEPGGKARLRAVAFRCVDTPLGQALEQAAAKPVALAGQLKRNRWQGYESAQLIIEDIAAI